MKKIYSIVSIALLAISLVSCANLENESKISTDLTVYATSSCVTDKKEGLPVKYLLPFNSTVTENENRPLSSGQSRICDTGYPSKKRVFIDKSGRVANSDEENLEDFTIENMTDSEFAEIGYTEEEK